MNKKGQNGSTMYTHVQWGPSWGFGERAKGTTLNKQTRTRPPIRALRLRAPITAQRVQKQGGRGSDNDVNINI